MLPQGGRRIAQHGRCGRQAQRAGHAGDVRDAIARFTILPARQRYGQAACLDLCVVKRLGNGVDGTAGHGLVFQQSNPIGRGARSGHSLHGGDELCAALHAKRVGGKAFVAGPLGLPGDCAKALELPVVANGQQHVAVLRGEVLVGREAGVAVAHAAGGQACGQKACGLVGQHGHAHVQQGHVDVLALACAVGGVVAHVQRGQDGVACVQAGEQVDDGHTHAHGAAAGGVVCMAGDAHQARHGLHHQVVACALGIGAVLAKAGDGAVDEPWVENPQAFMVQPVLLEAADLEVLHHDVRLQRHLLDEPLALGSGHVDGDRALVAIAGREVAGLVGVVALGILQKGRAPLARVVAQAWALHLHHICTQVCQHLRAPGARQNARQVKDSDTGQRARRCRGGIHGFE